ncbi:MAG: hypothetical protein IAF02_15635 [Anaerolineae bacterium]|nr:hypothetical protein [Anaerolineae bacterium]
MSAFIEEYDDLSVITGIGDSIQQRLRTSLHVHSYADLAALPIDTIASELKSDKSIPAPLKTRKKIEQWVVEADNLAKTQASHDSKAADWEPIDSFVLEFQRQVRAQGEFDFRVVVQHVEHDANGHWDFRIDEERENLFKWMETEANLDQIMMASVIRDDKQPEPKQTIDAQSIDFSWKNDVKPTQISFSQGGKTVTTAMIGKEERPFLAHIPHEQPLDVEVTFVLPFTPTTGDSSLRYSAQCQIHNLSQGIKPSYMQMGTTENFGDEPSISAKLSGVSLEPGIYELGVLVRGERPLGANYFKFPKLNVL